MGGTGSWWNTMTTETSSPKPYWVSPWADAACTCLLYGNQTSEPNLSDSVFWIVSVSLFVSFANCGLKRAVNKGDCQTLRWLHGRRSRRVYCAADQCCQIPSMHLIPRLCRGGGGGRDTVKRDRKHKVRRLNTNKQRRDGENPVIGSSRCCMSHICPCLSLQDNADCPFTLVLLQADSVSSSVVHIRRRSRSEPSARNCGCSLRLRRFRDLWKSRTSKAQSGSDVWIKSSERIGPGAMKCPLEKDQQKAEPQISCFSEQMINL